MVVFFILTTSDKNLGVPPAKCGGQAVRYIFFKAGAGNLMLVITKRANT